MRLDDYKIEKTFTSTNGECYIAISKLDGKKYFIKKNTDVSYGMSSDRPELRKTYKRKADEWLNYHNRIRKEFTKLGNGTGTTVFPIAYFVDGGKIYEIAHYIAIQPIAIEKLCKLSIDDKIRILQTSSFALKSIHSLGIVHGDLKPDNIPISKSEMGGYISKITDCGDAFYCNDIPDESQIVCTEPYWSPELASYKMGNIKAKKLLNSKNDVFAMGLIFHEWWTGDFPYYDGRDDFVSLYQVIYQSWPKKIQIDNSVPEWLATLILDMLCPEASKRPSMDEVFEAIKSRSYTSSILKNNVKAKPKGISLTQLQNAFARVPRDNNELRQYTEESVTEVLKLVRFGKENLKTLTQQQADILATRICKAIDSLELKPKDNSFKKIDKAIAYISSHDLSRFTPDSREKLLKLIDFANSLRDSKISEENVDRLFVAISNAYKGLVPRTDFSVEPVEDLPAPYTKVEVLSDDYVIAYYGEEGKIKLSVNNAIKMNLVRRK